MYGQPPFTQSSQRHTVLARHPARELDRIRIAPANSQLGVVVHRSAKLAFTVALCSLAVPGVAAAATKDVIAGKPVKKLPAGVAKDADLNQFFPSSIKVHAGDSVRFTIAGFHAVNFPKRGEAPPPLAAPDTSHPANNSVDSSGTAYWFNGQPTPVIPSIVSAGTGSGKPYTGAAAVGSGLPLGPPKPFVVKFPKAGSYTYYCVVHPGMKATVSVVGKSKPVPSAKADAARAAAQLAKSVTALKQLAQQKAPANTVIAGPDKTNGPVLLRFTPANLTTKVGTPITLEMTPGTTEDHTFTFAKDVKAAGKAADATFIGPLAGSSTSGPPTLAFDPKWAYPSDPPGAPVAINGTNHGDGFVNTGVLDGSPATPFPQKVTVSFSAPGTYTYLCAIHTFMTGKITVTS
jgi:plastocyanin